MKNKTKIAIAVLTIAALAGTYFIGEIKADYQSGYLPVVESLTERFNLNEDEVKTFFEEKWQEKKEERLQSHQQKLDQAVSDGVITGEQKQALLDKFEEKMEKRQQEREEMREWMESSGIDFEKLSDYMGFGRGFAKGFKMGYHMGM